MRIIVITDQFPPRIGGMAVHAFHIAQYLSQKHQVFVLKEKFPHYQQNHNSFLVKEIISRRFPLIDLVKILLTCCKIKPDIIHVCTSGLNYGVLSKRYTVITRAVGNDFLRPWAGFHLPGKFLIDHIQNRNITQQFDRLETKIRKSIVLKRQKKSAFIIANSHWTKNELVSLGVSSEKIEVVTGGVNLNIFVPATNIMETRKELQLPLDGNILLTVANLVAKKNIQSVLRALPEVIERCGFTQYIIVGDGPYKINLEKLTDELNLREYVLFVGKKYEDALVKYYQCADVYVQPSFNAKMSNGYIDVETMGRTYMEAMACKVPVIASNLGGIPDVVFNLHTGILLNNPQDIAEITKWIIELISNTKLRNNLSNEAYNYVIKKFSWYQVGKKIENLIYKLTNYLSY